MIPKRTAIYAKNIHKNERPLNKCFGLIDCTKIRVIYLERHGTIQRACCSDHKQMYCLSQQTISPLNDLIFCLCGPLKGQRYQFLLLRESNWKLVIGEKMCLSGQQLYVFGEIFYIMRPNWQYPFLQEFALLGKQRFSFAMSSVKILVEHNYRDLKQIWCSEDCAKSLRDRHAPIGLLYRDAEILLEFIICVQRGGQTTASFALIPPFLEPYLTYK